MTEFRIIDYLDHIEQAASEALGFVRNHSREEFDTDRRTQLAVIMSLTVMGEAAARLSEKYPEFVADNAQIAWRQMRGMRNHVVHGYFDIDLDVIWETVVRALPELLEQIADARTRFSEQ